jgi:hypothetical protein
MFDAIHSSNFPSNTQTGYLSHGLLIKKDYEDEVTVDYFKVLCRNMPGETEKNNGYLSTSNQRPEEDQEPPITEQKRKSASTATDKN